jgi:ubiquitin-protein ligase
MSADSHDAATLARVAGTALVEDYERTIKEYMILQELYVIVSRCLAMHALCRIHFRIPADLPDPRLWLNPRLCSKLLKEHIPEGLYIMPATSNIFHWHGTVFLRKGTYAAGIFKFLIDIPATFPEERPRVFFKTPLFHPLVHEKTGELDLDPELEGWPTSHRFMGHILNYIKRIFFRPQLCDPKPVRLC